MAIVKFYIENLFLYFLFTFSVWTVSPTLIVFQIFRLFCPDLFYLPPVVAHHQKFPLSRKNTKSLPTKNAEILLKFEPNLMNFWYFLVQVQRGHNVWMLVICGSGDPCLNLLSAKRSPHLNVGYLWWCGSMPESFKYINMSECVKLNH